jgi:uncharacterized protein with PIN domain
LDSLAYSRMKKVRVIVKTVSSRHQIYVDRNGEHTLYAVTDKLPEVKELVLKAKRELGILPKAPLCQKCNERMQFSCTEPDKPGFVHHVYECVKCRSTQSFVTAL